VLKISFILIAILNFQSLTAQKDFHEFIDSSIGRSNFSSGDWALGLSTDRWGRIPLIDSLGNLIIEPEVNTTIMISKIQNTFYLQKFNNPCFGHDSCFHASRRITLPKGILIDYTIDSIIQVEKEYIYRYIYKSDSIGIYDYQEPGSHSTGYAMHFKTQKLDLHRIFDDVSFTEKLWFLPSSAKNLNFPYNSRTFVYRAFLKLTEFFKEHKAILLLN
jgi:hypothetical protein